MPELPEVETIRQDLRKKILNKKITLVHVYNRKSVGGADATFVRALTGNSITEIDRRGKFMFWRLKNGKEILAVHLKMTGQLIYEKEIRNKKHGNSVEIVAGGHKMTEKDIDALPNQWTRAAFMFADGGELFFNDLRLFGYMKLVSPEAVEKSLRTLGPEPRTKQFTQSYFESLFKKRTKTTIKALLLHQELIAGIGNIYADEACFCAGIRPSRRVGSISKAEQEKLFQCIPTIFTEAIHNRGTTFRNFLDSSGKKGNYTDFLRVYDRDGLPCKKCKTVIKKTRTAGRGTHFCPNCQK